MEPKPPPSPGGKSSGLTPRLRPSEPNWESLWSRFSPIFTALMPSVFMERLSGASSDEPGGAAGMGGAGPHGSMDTLALSSLQAAPPGTPLERRAAAATVEMDTLGSDLSRWGGTLPCAALPPPPPPLLLFLAAGEMGMISSSLLRMALEMDTLPLPASFSATRSAWEELLAPAEDEEEAAEGMEEAVREEEEEEWTLGCAEEVEEEGCLSAMRLAIP